MCFISLFNLPRAFSTAFFSEPANPAVFFHSTDNFPALSRTKVAPALSTSSKSSPT